MLPDRLFFWIILVMAKMKLSWSSEVLFALDADQVQNEVFDQSSSWLLVFYRGSCHRCVYQALDLLAFAKWIQGIVVENLLQEDFFIFFCKFGQS